VKAGWAVKPFGEVCTLQRGFDLPTQDRIPGDFPLVSASGIIDTHNEGPVAGPGVVTGRSGSIGSVFFVESGFWPLNTTLYVRDFHGNDPRFVWYLLNYFDLKRFAGGTGVPTLNRNDVHSELVSIPIAVNEQHRIVALLDEAFDGIATAKANAEQNLQNARALFESQLQQVFTERGEGWVERLLEEVVSSTCSLSYGIVQPGDDFRNGLPVVRPTDLTTQLITADRLKRIDPKLANGYKRTALRGGELLLCVRGSTGIVSVAAPELAGANVTRGIVPITFEPSILRQGFGYFLMISEMVQNQIRAKTYGTALMQINIGDLRKVTVAIPPIAQQEAITAKLELLQSETQRLESLYQQKLAALDALKNSLLHQAFSGTL
jgi:type I restriction enzyme S subunit